MSDDNILERAINNRAKTAMRNYRLASGRSMREMAEFLQIDPDSYEQYEGTKPKSKQPARGVPAWVISRFCDFAQQDIDWIMFGKKRKEKVAS